MADKTLDQLNLLASTDVTSDDKILVFNSGDGTTRQADVLSLLQRAKEHSIGYFALLTNFYFTGGVPTSTEVEVEDINTWIDVNFTTDAAGTFDNRPQPMKDGIADPFNEFTSKFSLEGMDQQSSATFRASMTYEPDDDEGQLEARLLFNRHSGASPSEDFSIEDVALSMAQGADVEYPAEPTLTFFVGDTIDTNAPGDAGLCRFQVRSTVPGTLKMRALTWYINQ